MLAPILVALEYRADLATVWLFDKKKLATPDRIMFDAYVFKIYP